MDLESTSSLLCTIGMQSREAQQNRYMRSWILAQRRVKGTLYGTDVDPSLFTGATYHSYLRISTQIGETQLQSTYATKIYMNLDIPEARILKQRQDEAPEVKFVDITPVEGGEEPEYKTLIELMQMEMPNEKKQFTCSGTIT